MSYKKAYDELEKIVSDIEDAETPIDVLVEKVKKANDLIEYCQSKLRDVEFELDKIVSKKSK